MEPAYGVAAWSSPAWIAGATAWLDEQLAAARPRAHRSAAEQTRVRPWSTLIRAPTARRTTSDDQGGRPGDGVRGRAGAAARPSWNATTAVLTPQRGRPGARLAAPARRRRAAAGRTVLDAAQPARCASSAGSPNRVYERHRQPWMLRIAVMRGTRHADWRSSAAWPIIACARLVPRAAGPSSSRRSSGSPRGVGDGSAPSTRARRARAPASTTQRVGALVGAAAARPSQISSIGARCVEGGRAERARRDDRRRPDGRARGPRAERAGADALDRLARRQLRRCQAARAAPPRPPRRPAASSGRARRAGGAPASPTRARLARRAARPRRRRSRERMVDNGIVASRYARSVVERCGARPTAA